MGWIVLVAVVGAVMVLLSKLNRRRPEGPAAEGGGSVPAIGSADGGEGGSEGGGACGEGGGDGC